MAPLGHHAVQEGEVVALGLVQLDEGALAQLAGQPVTLLHQKRERRIGGVVVPLTGGDDAGKAGREPPPLALYLDLDGTLEGITSWAWSWLWLQTSLW